MNGKILVLAKVIGLFLILGLSPAGQEQAKAPKAERVSKLGDFLQHLSWSPDGKRFLFTRIHKGKMGLWTMNVDGSDVQALLPSESMPHFDGHFSPDGKKIVFVYDKLQGTDGKLQIDVVNADGTEHKNLIPHKAFEE